MDKYGKLIDNQTLRFERLLPGPIERIWEYITDADKRSLWFCGGTSSLTPRDEIKFVFHNSQLGYPKEQAPEKYKEYGDGFESKAVVIKSEKPNLFVMEWEGIVTFELTEAEDMIKLTLTHEKLADNTQVGTLAGWHAHLTMLIDQLNGVNSQSFWTLHNQLEEEYTQSLG